MKISKVFKTTYIKKCVSVLCIMLTLVTLFTFMAPDAAVIKADAASKSRYVFDAEYGSLYNGEYKGYNFTLSARSYVNLWFTSYTDGDYLVEIYKNGKCVKSYSDYYTSDNYFYLDAGSYQLYITENSSYSEESLYYCFYMTAEWNEFIKTKSVSISPKKLNMIRYLYYNVKGSFSPWNSDQSCSWSSSDKKVATVSGGSVYARNFGKTTITYKHGSKKAKCKATVNEEWLELGKGKSKSVRKWMKYVKGYKKAKWSSNKKSKVTVSKKGKIKAKKGGNATVTAKIKGTKYKIKVFSYDKKTLKKKTKNSLEDALYVPSSLKIQTVKYPDFKHCKIYYSAKTRYGERIYGAWMGYYSYGNFYYYKVF